MPILAQSGYRYGHPPKRQQATSDFAELPWYGEKALP
jgi:hypothetical protein